MTVYELAPTDAEVRRSTVRDLATAFVVAAGVGFNMLLCYASTRGLSVSVGSIIGVELLLCFCALLLGLKKMPMQFVIGTCFFLAYIFFFFAVGRKIDPKIVRDLGIAWVFYFAGMACTRNFPLPKFVLIVVLAVFAIGLVEYSIADTWANYFDVQKYFISKGAVSPGDMFTGDPGLAENAQRPEGEGRSLLPFLGDRRISSVLLEPISAGNFGFLAVLCGLAFLGNARRAGLALIVLGLAITVLADSRLGLLLSMIAITVWAVSILQDVRFLFFLLFVVVGLLLLFPQFYTPRTIDNSIGGRLYFSGRLLLSFGPLEWFALVDSSKFTGDSGYAYIFQKVGIVGVVWLWIMFLMIPTRTRAAAVFRAGLAFYIVISLCVSEAVFSIKTAALAWFVMGALNRDEDREPDRDPIRFG